MDSAYADLDRPPLDPAALRRSLVDGASRWRDIVVRESVESTNAEVAELALGGAGEGVVVVAEHQRGGRGRQGRVWQAPPRSGLAVSMLLRPDRVAAARWPWLPLLTGVAVADAVRRCADVEAVLKWPNDVVVGGRKLAGILVERVEVGGRAAAVVGIGLNVSSRAEELPVGDATSLLLVGARTTDRTVVLREVLRVLDQLYGAWLSAEGDPGAGLADAYRRRCATLGRQVRAELPSGDVVTGAARRIDAEGRLVIETDVAVVAISAGDVVHLRDA
jgi:BirA family biotin operon repressor/biotin-[acetyl-CoA-carboxylase] ligase